MQITQIDLVRRCKAAGWNVSRPALAKIENLSRSVSDYELLALSTALRISIARLLSAPATDRKRKTR